MHSHKTSECLFMKNVLKLTPIEYAQHCSNQQQKLHEESKLNDEHLTRNKINQQQKKTQKLLKNAQNRATNRLVFLFDAWTDNSFAAPSVKKMGKHLTLYFFAMQTVAALIVFLFYLPALGSDYVTVCWSLIGIDVFQIFLWCLAHFSDPGILHKPDKHEIEKAFDQRLNTDANVCNKEI